MSRCLGHPLSLSLSLSFSHYSSLSASSVSSFLRLPPFSLSPDRHSPDPSVETNVIPRRTRALPFLFTIRGWIREEYACVYTLGSRFQGGARLLAPMETWAITEGRLNKRQGGDENVWNGGCGRLRDRPLKAFDSSPFMRGFLIGKCVRRRDDLRGSPPRLVPPIPRSQLFPSFIPLNNCSPGFVLLWIRDPRKLNFNS